MAESTDNSNARLARYVGAQTRRDSAALIR
jgi:hypothetical protein